MSNIVTTLPPPPAGFSHHLLVYRHDTSHSAGYFLILFNGSATNIEYSNGSICTPHHYYSSLSSDGTWGEPTYSANLSVQAEFSMTAEPGNYFLASDFNVIDEDGFILKHAMSSFFTQDELSIVGDSVSSNDLTGVIFEMVAIVPVILVVVLSCIGFRKALAFLKSKLRGC